MVMICSETGQGNIQAFKVKISTIREMDCCTICKLQRNSLALHVATILGKDWWHNIA